MDPPPLSCQSSVQSAAELDDEDEHTDYESVEDLSHVRALDQDELREELRDSVRSHLAVPEHIGLNRSALHHEVLSTPPTAHSESNVHDDVPDNLHDRRKWIAVPDLDLFFGDVYRYWRHGGLNGFVAHSLSHACVLLFACFFSTFLLLFVDWKGIYKNCQGDGDDVCAETPGLRTDLFNGVGDVIVVMYFAVFLLFCLWQMATAISKSNRMRGTAQFFRDVLDIRDNELPNYGWQDVTTRLEEVQTKVRLSLVLHKCDAADMTARIMRRDNFWIAMLSEHALDFSFGDGFMSLLRRLGRWNVPERQQLTVASRDVEMEATRENPWISTGLLDDSLHNAYEHHNLQQQRRETAEQQFARRRQFFGNFVEFLTRRAIAFLLGRLQHTPARTRASELYAVPQWDTEDESAVQSDAYALRQLFLMLSVGTLVTMPFTLLMMTALFVLRNLEQMVNSNGSNGVFGPRDWSPLARVLLRDLNELPHLFEQRLAAAEEPATMYIEHFPAPVRRAVAQLAAFMSGACVGVLVAMSLYNSRVLLHFQFLGRSLLWYLPLLLVLLGAARSASRLGATGALQQDGPAQLLQKAAVHTHFMPRHWKHQAHTRSTHEQFSKLYAPRLNLFLRELMSVVAAPLLFAVPMRRRAEHIVRTMRKLAVADADGSGRVECALGAWRNSLPPTTTPLERENDQPHTQQSLLLSRESVGELILRAESELMPDLPEPERPFGSSKLQQSIMSFAKNHPRWRRSHVERTVMDPSVMLASHDRASSDALQLRQRRASPWQPSP
ncbi:MAG: hypothetical protein MHM6MM_005614 [Cercozoa sp. M6MM]